MYDKDHEELRKYLKDLLDVQGDKSCLASSPIVANELMVYLAEKTREESHANGLESLKINKKAVRFAGWALFISIISLTVSIILNVITI